MDPGDVRPYLALFSLSALAVLAVTAAVPWYVWLTAAGLYAGAALLVRHAPDLSGRRAQIAAVAAAVLLVAAPSVVLAAHIAGTVPVQGGVPLSSEDNTTVVIDGPQASAYLENFETLTGQVDVITEAGNMTVFSSGDTEVHVLPSEITGTWTNLTQIDTSVNTVQVTPADKPQVTLGKQIDKFNYTGAYAIDDGTVDFVYEGASGESRVTIPGDAQSQQLVAIDADTGTILDVATSGSGGTVTFDELTNSKHAVTVQTYDGDGPVLSNPAPTGGQSTEPSQLSVDVNDSEFPDGDSVTVTIWLDGTQQTQQTLTSNGTVTTTIPTSGLTGGQHAWNVTATDDFGGQATANYTYSIPDQLIIRHELNHSDLVDSPVSVNGTFFGGNSDTIVRKGPVTDGTINMTGLPVTENFVVEVNSTNNNLTNRTAYIQSIFEQQSAYLLNRSKVSTVEVRFRLNDPTGEFGPSSVLYVQRPINTSTQVEWQTVHADQFGVEGVTTTLEEGQRYRVKVGNNDTEQVVGPYRADVAETVQVEPGTPSVSLGDFVNGWDADATLDNDTLTWAYSDPQQQTDTLTVWIHERGNESNRLVANSTFFDLGNASAKHTLTKPQTKKTWVVEFIVDRGTDEFTHTITLSNTFDFFGAIGTNARLALGIGTLFVFAGLFSLLNATIGALVVALVGGLWWLIGLLPGATSAIAVVLGLFLAAANYIRKGRGV